jgi:hypothetical protein
VLDERGISDACVMEEKQRSDVSDRGVMDALMLNSSESAVNKQRIRRESVVH